MRFQGRFDEATGPTEIAAFEYTAICCNVGGAARSLAEAATLRHVMRRDTERGRAPQCVQRDASCSLHRLLPGDLLSGCAAA